MRLPGRAHAGVTVAEQVRAIDVLPTLAAIAGVPMAARRRRERAGARRRARARARPAFVVRRDVLPEVALRVERAEVDPRRSLEVHRRAEAGALRPARGRRRTAQRRGRARHRWWPAWPARSTKIAAGFGAAATTDAPQPDADTLARLRSLGYVGMAAPSPAGARGADPKDMIASAEAFRTGISRAMDALARDQPAAAIAQLKQLLTINDRSYELHLFLGDAYTGDAAVRQRARRVRRRAPAEPAQRRAAAVGRPRVSRAGRHDARAAAGRRGRGASSPAAATSASCAARSTSAPAGRRRRWPSTRPRSAPTARIRRRARVWPAWRCGRGSSTSARPQFEALLRMGYRPSRMHFGLAQIAEATGRHRARDRRVSGGDPARAVVRRREDGAGQARRVRWKV